MHILIFPAFNFCHSGYGRKYFNGENFPIYGTTCIDSGTCYMPWYNLHTELEWVADWSCNQCVKLKYSFTACLHRESVDSRLSDYAASHWSWTTFDVSSSSQWLNWGKLHISWKKLSIYSYLFHTSWHHCMQANFLLLYSCQNHWNELGDTSNERGKKVAWPTGAK